MLRFKPVLVLGALLLTGLLVLAGCGSSSSSSSSSSAPSSSASATASSSASSTASAQPASGSAGSCGTIPTAAPGDPDRVLAKFPQSVQASYNLLGSPVHASAWAKWKPKSKGPYTIYFSPGNVATPYIQSMLAEFDQLKAKSPNITKVIVQDSNNSLQTQIQQIQQAIREKVSLLVILPLSAAADAPVMAAAGKAGIPVIAPLSVAGSPYVVGLNGNVILEGAALGQGLASVLNGKGSVLDVHGIPGVLSDSGIFQGASDVFKSCPNIKTAGSVVGQFTPSVAKTATLQFLSAHPQPVDGAIHVGGMGLGILQAFQQTGHKVPAIADDGATPGLLAYWNAHKDTYKGVALGLPPGQIAQATWYLAEGLFAGKGLKISDISEPPIIITNKNLSQWVEPGWTVSTPIAYAPGPPGVAYPPSYLNQFFAKAAGK